MSSLSIAHKRAVADRAQNCCEYCLSQVDYSSDPFSIDHIIPRSAGGSDELENLAYACMGCNGHKLTSTMATDSSTGEMVALYNPRRHEWHEHFTWNEDASLILGKTSTARATIERLRLNRSGVVNLRRMLAGEERHPPF